MILHTLNASPASAAFSDCLAVLAPGDALLLLGDGVYAALPGSEAHDRLETSGAAWHVLRADAVAAGVAARIDAAALVDIDGFVALSEQFVRQMAWY